MARFTVTVCVLLVSCTLSTSAIRCYSTNRPTGEVIEKECAEKFCYDMFLENGDTRFQLPNCGINCRKECAEKFCYDMFLENGDTRFQLPNCGINCRENGEKVVNNPKGKKMWIKCCDTHLCNSRKASGKSDISI